MPGVIFNQVAAKAVVGWTGPRPLATMIPLYDHPPRYGQRSILTTAGHAFVGTLILWALIGPGEPLFGVSSSFTAPCGIPWLPSVVGNQLAAILM